MRDPEGRAPQTAMCRQGGKLQPFEVKVISGPDAARTALQQVLEGLTPLTLDRDAANTVELVLAEAINNVVEHAYPPPDISGPIHIVAQHRCDGLHFTIRDVGRPMPGGRTPPGNPMPRDLDIANLPEGGFGWHLIKRLARDVSYIRSGAANQLCLSMTVPQQNAGQAGALD